MKGGSMIIRSIMMFCSLLLTVGTAGEQQPERRCMNDLRFCIKYLNNTRLQPPDSCCQPLDIVVKSIPECFCTLMSTVLGVNRVGRAAWDDASGAQTLPGRCGHRVNPVDCITGRNNAQSHNPIPNSVTCKYWSSSFIVATAASSIFLIFQAL